MDNKNYDEMLWYQTSDGYWRNKKHGRQHTYVYEKLTGCKVFPHQVIHHMDGDRSNNTAGNLVYLTKSQHAYLHSKTRSKETKEKLSIANIGKKRSEETKEKMSNSRIGKKRSYETNEKIWCGHIQNGPQKNNLSGYKGVCQSGKKWAVQINNNKVREYLGCYSTPLEAAIIYNQRAKELWGSETYQNIIER